MKMFLLTFFSLSCLNDALVIIFHVLCSCSEKMTPKNLKPKEREREREREGNTTRFLTSVFHNHDRDLHSTDPRSLALIFPGGFARSDTVELQKLRGESRCGCRVSELSVVPLPPGVHTSVSMECDRVGIARSNGHVEAQSIDLTRG